MFRTFINAFKVPDLKKKLLITGLILVLYRIGACLPVPFVDASVLTQQAESFSTSIFGFINLLSGNAFTQSTLFALGVSPYITASIIVQLLAVAFPKIAGEGEEGKRRMQSITRYITVGVSLATAIGYYLLLKSNHALMEGFDGIFYAIIIIACYCAGSSLVMWLGERINEYGIGNGISLILFANIISSVPSLISALIQTVVKDPLFGSIYALGIAVLMSALIWLVIFISDSERRIPVQYAKKVVGRKMYGGQNTNLPIKLNMTGVMPIIFANSIISIHSLITMFWTPRKGTFMDKFFTAFTSESWVYAVLTLVLIIGFAYFYVAISFNPIEVASNMQKNGGSIPGIRPGRATSDFITRVLRRITFIGALYLAVIAVVPVVIQLIISIFSNYSIAAFAFGGTSIIIVVGVILETVREIEAQMTMRHYKGFLE